MFETMEKELETQFTDLLSIVNDGVANASINLNDNLNDISNDNPLDSNKPHDSLEAINNQLSEELNEKLQSIEQVKEELDEELRKRDSLIIEFDKLDQTGYFSSENTSSSNGLLDYFDTTDSALFQKNNCETIEEKDENASEYEQLIDKFTNMNSTFFNLSRTNLNSVLEEDENEDSSAHDDLIEINDVNELSLLDEGNKELNNNFDPISSDLNCIKPTVADHTLSPKVKRKSNCSSNNDSTHREDSLGTRNSITSSTNVSMSTVTNSSMTTNTLYNTLTTTNSISSSTTVSALNSLSSSMTRNESVLNLESLNSETNILVNNIVKKGIVQIWQQTKFNKSGGLTTSSSSNSLKSNAKRIFFSIGTTKLRKWKSRYFMLTENYLLCFKKGNKSDFLSRMGKFQFKLNLLDDIRSINLNETTSHGKSYSVDVNDGMMLMFDKDYNLLKEWYDSLVKTRQRCEMNRQEQEIKFRKEKKGIERKEIKEILSERIERRKMVVSSGGEQQQRRESLLDKFSEKYLDKNLHNSSSKLSSSSKKNDDECAFEYLNNLKQRLTGARSVTELNRSHSNLAQVKTNTPIINNRKRMSLQRKSLLSQFDSFLGSPLSHSSSRQQIHQQQQPQDNIVNLANLANLTAGASSNNNNPNWENQNQKLIAESTQSPTMLPRIAPQCQGNQLNNVKQSNGKQLTNSCSVFHFNTNSGVHNSPFTLNNSPALTQRSLYAERILSNSSLTLSNLSRFPNSRNSTLSSGTTSFGQSLFKPFRESIHYATSLRKDNCAMESKSHLKSATSEFSFIRLTNNNNNNASSSNTSTLTKQAGRQATDDDTLKRSNRKSKANFNRMPSFANDHHGSDYVDSEQDLSTASTDAYNSDTLRNELKNSKTITNLNSELSNRTLILNSNDIGLGHLNGNGLINNNVTHINNHHLSNNLINNQMNSHNNHHNYQKLKKINNSLDESDSTFSSSNSSSCSSSNYHPIINSHAQRQSTRIDQIDSLQHNNAKDLLSSSPQLSQSPRLINSPRMTNSPSQPIGNSPLVNQRNKKNSSKNDHFDSQPDHTYQKVNNTKRTSSSKQSTNKSSKTASLSSKPLQNGSRFQSKKKASCIPVACNRTYGVLNEPIYQSTEKRKSRMNKILENQSKIYVTMSDLK